MTKFKNGHNTKAGKCDLKPANQTYKNRNYLDIKGYTIVEDSFMITMKEKRLLNAGIQECIN